MPEDIQSQTSEESAHIPFVELGEGDAPLELGDDGGESEATEAAGDESLATDSEADDTEKSEMPSAESLGLDLSDPKQKAAYAELVKRHGQWTNKFLAKHKTKPEPEAPTTKEAPPQAAGGEDPFSDLFKVDHASFKPEAKPFAEESALSGLESELRDFVDFIVQQRFDNGLQQVAAKDRSLREKMAVDGQRQQALAAIAPYFDAVKDHPEFDSKFGEIQEFAKATETLAIRNPERWVRMVEAEFDLPRDWRGTANAAQRATGQKNQRIADKHLAAVARPSRPAPSSGGYASYDDEIDAKLAKLGIR